MLNISKKLRKVNKENLETQIKALYQQVALDPTKEFHFEVGRSLAERLGYEAEKLDHIAPESIASFAGVGYHFDLAQLQPGEYVADFGSGAGMDVFYAGALVGKVGKAVGIDMTLEQVEKSIQAKQQMNMEQVSFHPSYIEQTEFAANQFDVVMSNGVVNLSADKIQVFQEMARILKPGGRLVISDIVSSRSYSVLFAYDARLWASCIAGAMQFDDYQKVINQAGFGITHIKENTYRFLSESAKETTENYGVKSISLVAVKTLKD